MRFKESTPRKERQDARAFLSPEQKKEQTPLELVRESLRRKIPDILEAINREQNMEIYMKDAALLKIVLPEYLSQLSWQQNWEQVKKDVETKHKKVQGQFDFDKLPVTGHLVLLRPEYRRDVQKRHNLYTHLLQLPLQIKKHILSPSYDINTDLLLHLSVLFPERRSTRQELNTHMIGTPNEEAMEMVQGIMELSAQLKEHEWEDYLQNAAAMRIAFTDYTPTLQPNEINALLSFLRGDDDDDHLRGIIEDLELHTYAAIVTAPEVTIDEQGIRLFAPVTAAAPRPLPGRSIV